MDFYVKTRFIPPSDLHDFPIDLPVVAHFFELKGFGPFVFEERGTVGLRKDGLCAISVHGYFQIIKDGQKYLVERIYPDDTLRVVILSLVKLDDADPEPEPDP